MLAAVAVVLGARLLRGGAAARRAWGAALVATALAALVGGTEHGLRPRLSPGARFWMWEATYLAIGLANLLLLAGAAIVGLRAPFRTAALVVLVVRFAVYAVVLTRQQDFRWVILDFAVTLVVLAALATWGRWRGAAWAPWTMGAVAVSVAGAAIQGLGLAPHRHFNHNDLFHVVQTLGVWLFYRAGLLFDGSSRRISSIR